jgi:hypothetical protein
MQQTRTVAVGINIFQEPRAQITECLRRLRGNLAQATVRIFLNGPFDSRVSDLCESFGSPVRPGENLGTNASWHLWWLRMLEFFRDSQCDVCLKIDPDTMVDTTPIAFPDADYFGCLEVSQRYRIPFVQGGVAGLSQRAVCGILASEVLLPGPNKPWIGPQGWDALADDQHLACALRSIGITGASWRECFSQWKTPVANEPVKYAIVHPRYYHDEIFHHADVA